MQKMLLKKANCRLSNTKSTCATKILASSISVQVNVPRIDLQTRNPGKPAPQKTSIKRRKQTTQKKLAN
jgi:hypothetical protein